MFNQSIHGIVLFIVICTIFILLLIIFLAIIVFKYQQKQNAHFKGMEEMKVAHENNMLKLKVEIQEQTFQNISQEIHDNIGQKLTLSKLHLNTIIDAEKEASKSKVTDAIRGISEAIEDLSDLSRSMSSEIIHNNGFIGALEFEVSQLNKLGLYNMKLIVTGDSAYLDAQRELLLFRIVQEALHNIVKHAEATQVNIDLHYTPTKLTLKVVDNGKGFVVDSYQPGNGIGNMGKRANLLGGNCQIITVPKEGTSIIIQIPTYE